MPTVETTGGPVDVEQLGLTLIHEHFRTTDEAVASSSRTSTTSRRSGRRRSPMPTP